MKWGNSKQLKKNFKENSFEYYRIKRTAEEGSVARHSEVFEAGGNVARIMNKRCFTVGVNHYHKRYKLVADPATQFRSFKNYILGLQSDLFWF